MARIRLRESEYEDGRLPPVCVVCGEPADGTEGHTFRWMPDWLSAVLVALALLAPLLAVIAYFATLGAVWRRRFPVPVCARHRGYWKRRAFWTYGPLALGVTLLTIFVIAALSQPPRSNTDWLVAPCFGTGAFTLVGLMLAAVLQRGTVRADQITETEVALIRVHDNFADAVLDRRRARRRERDLDRDDEDYDTPPPRRRRREPDEPDDRFRAGRDLDDRPRRRRAEDED